MLRPQVYWHLWHPNGSNIGQLLLAEQALALEESGLAEAADVHLSVVGPPLVVDDPYTCAKDANYPSGPGFAADYPWLKHVRVHGPEADGLYEGVTLEALWLAAQTSDPKTPFLYFHGKGASNMTRCRNRWRRFMEHFCIARWRTAVAVLEQYDTYGTLWYPHPPHYSGNFWWATAGYLASLYHPIHDQHPENVQGRFKYEAWLCANRPRSFNAYDDKQDHYAVPLPPPSECMARMPN
jgi:hypothetical protein